MNASDRPNVVLTGIGVVTPLGNAPEEVLHRIQAGESAAAAPSSFEANAFDCPLCAEVSGFEPQRYVAEAKMVRLMNRDAQLAVAAARLALQDACVKPGLTYPATDIGLFGATGLAGLPVREVTPLIKVSCNSAGHFDPPLFGNSGLKAVSPILSFKILSNMPFCFVSINENIQGPNAIFTPWEGDGAQAVEAGIRALRAGDARCALVGGCDVKTHALAFASLQQQGLFSSWQKAGSGALPAEGAAFLVLESEKEARDRGAHIYARLGPFKLRPHFRSEPIAETRAAVLEQLHLSETEAVVGSADGNEGSEEQEISLLDAVGLSSAKRLCPKVHVGNTFAAAAPLQIALGAALAGDGAKAVLANCFGFGNTQAAFVLHPA